MDPKPPVTADMEHQHRDEDFHDIGKTKTEHSEFLAEGKNFEIDEDALPPGYFRSKFFLGSMTGIGLGLMAGVAGYGYAAPILSIINADIGPVCFPHLAARTIRITDLSYRIRTLSG